MATVPTERIDVYQHVTDTIIEQLERGVAPWRKCWATLGGIPRNLVSKKAYRGINCFLLALSQYESPWWLTFKQAKDLGGHVKRGEKSTLIVFWKWLEIIDKETGKPAKIPLLRHYRVFNSEQCELGAKQPEAALPRNEFDPIVACEAVVEGMPEKPEIVFEGGQPCYIPKLDRVRMPERSRFESPEGFYSTFFHELAHSTGHSSRLDRPGIVDVVAFGSPNYSREELVAEMSAGFLCAHTGIENASTIENSAAYLAGWLKRLKGDKTLVVQAAGQAQKATDFILKTTFDDSAGE